MKSAGPITEAMTPLRYWLGWLAMFIPIGSLLAFIAWQFWSLNANLAELIRLVGKR